MFSLHSINIHINIYNTQQISKLINGQVFISFRLIRVLQVRTHHPGCVDVIKGGGQGLGVAGGGGLHRLHPGIHARSRELAGGEKPLLHGHGASAGVRSGGHGGATAAAWREAGVGVGDSGCHGHPHFLHYNVVIRHCWIDQSGNQAIRQSG
jgi:hypothetical protein